MSELEHKSNTKQLFYKAGFSSLAGLPIAYLLNISILPFFVTEIAENAMIAGALICIPFVMASITRIFIIDYVYDKWHINLNPTHIIRIAVHKEITAWKVKKGEA